MKKISKDFKKSLRGTRQLDCRASFLSNDLSDAILMENGTNLFLEDNKKLLTESAIKEIPLKLLNKTSLISNASFGKTLMKQLQMESKISVPKMKKINIKIGIMVNENYEYLDFGNFLVKDCPYNLESNLYTVTGYDKMLEAMISFDDNPLKVKYPITHRNLLIAMCKKLRWKYDIPSVYPNSNKLIKKDIYSGNNMTYRDVLDDMNTVVGGAFIFDINDIFKIKFIGDSIFNSTKLPYVLTENTVLNVNDGRNQNLEVNGVDIKSDNVSFEKLIGPINVVSYNDTNGIERVLGSIPAAEIHTYNIKDCKLLENDADGEFNDELFEVLKGMKYYIYDFNTKGILNIEPLDCFYAFYDNTYYDCVMFNNIITVDNGLEEQSYTDDTEDEQNDYTVNTPSSTAIKDAVIQTNKNAGTIVLKVTSDNKLAQAKLDASADEGTKFVVSADDIDFKSHKFNLATDDISIVSNNVSISNNGIQLSNGATIAGENGLITNLFYTSAGEMGGYQRLGFTGYSPSGSDTQEIVHQNVYLDAYIPEDFTILHAYLTMQHCQIEWYYTNGSASEIKIYNSNGNYFINNSSNSLIINDNDLNEMPNALGIESWSPQSKNMESVTGIDIKNYLKNGMNTIVARSSASEPTDEQSLEAKTGAGKLTLNVIGFVAYER